MSTKQGCFFGDGGGGEELFWNETLIIRSFSYLMTWKYYGSIFFKPVQLLLFFPLVFGKEKSKVNWI